jgi:hypothetical protein
MLTLSLYEDEKIYTPSEEIDIIKKAIKVARKLDVNVDCLIRCEDDSYKQYVIKPNDSIERVMRRWSLQNVR